MRRPLAVELSAEDRSLARRWVAMSGSVYWTIVMVMIAAMLATSTADKAAVASKREQTSLSQDRSDPLPYGSLPDIARPIPACNASQPCIARKANSAGAAN
jgi:hypothetical protein